MRRQNVIFRQVFNDKLSTARLETPETGYPESIVVLMENDGGNEMVLKKKDFDNIYRVFNGLPVVKVKKSEDKVLGEN